LSFYVYQSDRRRAEIYRIGVERNGLSKKKTEKSHSIDLKRIFRAATALYGFEPESNGKDATAYFGFIILARLCLFFVQRFRKSFPQAQAELLCING
jgi:hypothetical protein